MKLTIHALRTVIVAQNAGGRLGVLCARGCVSRGNRVCTASEVSAGRCEVRLSRLRIRNAGQRREWRAWIFNRRRVRAWLLTKPTQRRAIGSRRCVDRCKCRNAVDPTRRTLVPFVRGIACYCVRELSLSAAAARCGQERVSGEVTVTGSGGRGQCSRAAGQQGSVTEALHQLQRRNFLLFGRKHGTRRWGSAATCGP